MAQDIKPVGLEFYPEVNQALLKVQTKSDKPPSQQAISQIAAKFQQPATQPVFPQFGGQQPTGGFVDPYAPLLQDLDVSRQAAVDDQRRGISEYEDLLKSHLDKTGQGQKIDLSPLMALSDTWFGGNLAGNYKRPTDSKAALETTAALQQGLQKARGALTDDEMQYLATRGSLLQKANESRVNQDIAKARLEESKAATGAAKDYKNEKLSLEQKDKYNKEFGKVINGSSVFITSAQKVKDIIRQNGGEIPYTGPLAKEFESEVGGMMANYNRYVAELGALSGPDASIIEKKIGVSVNSMPNFIGSNVKGGGQSVNRVLDNILGNMKESHERTRERIKTIYGGYADDAFKVDDETFQKSLKGEMYGGRGIQTQAPTDGMTREQKIQEIIRRQQGG